MSRRRNNRKPNNNVSANSNTANVNTEEQTQIVTIMRACAPGEVNINGVKYTIDSYKKALEEFKSAVSRSEIFFGITNPYNEFDYKRFRVADPDSCCADIVEIKDDCVVYEIPDKKLYDIIKQALEDGIANVQMRYFGTAVDKEKDSDDSRLYIINKIVGFDIMIKGEYPFKNYIEFVNQDTNEKG